MRFFERLRRLMYGRYGLDGLWYVLITICVILSIVNLFVTSYVIQIIEMVVMMIAIYRVFSTNRTRRMKENAWVMKLVRPFWVRIFRLKYLKTHVYRTCPHCGKTLRFPRKKGVHQATCPMCHQELTVKIHF